MTFAKASDSQAYSSKVWFDVGGDEEDVAGLSGSAVDGVWIGVRWS